MTEQSYTMRFRLALVLGIVILLLYFYDYFIQENSGTSTNLLNQINATQRFTDKDVANVTAAAETFIINSETVERNKIIGNGIKNNNAQKFNITKTNLEEFGTRKFVSTTTQSILLDGESAKNNGTDTMRGKIPIVRFENYSHHLIFPERNVSELQYHLKGIADIMQPFVEELHRLQNDQFVSNAEWPDSDKLPTTLAHALRENYFEKVAHPQIRTIFVNVGKQKIMKHLYNKLYDYSGNNCEEMEAGYPERKTAERMFGAKCVAREQSLSPVPFHDNAFTVGMPELFKVQQHEHVTLTYIHVIQNAFVTHDGDVYVGDLEIVPQRCDALHPQPTKPVINQTKTPHDEVFTIAQFWGMGFFHATAEELPRLSPWLDFLRDNPQIKIHVNTKTGFLYTMLTQLGINPSRVISGSKRVNLLYMPAGTKCGTPAVFNAELLSMRFRSTITRNPEPRKSIVVIKRSFHRYLKHHDQIFHMIKNVVKGTDIKIELFSDEWLPSLGDTIAMFNRAFLVIGPHGAGETNLFFSEPGTVNIESLCVSGRSPETPKGRVTSLCYRNLARVLGLRYYGILPEAEADCKETQPEDFEEILKFYINSLYLNMTS